MEEKNSFLDFASSVTDPRSERNKLHPIEEILLLTLSAFIRGADSRNDIELFGQNKIDFLREFLPFENGIPGDDTLRRFFRALEPEQFSIAFNGWIKTLPAYGESNVVAIDGKTSRKSFDSGTKALHTVSAFATESKLVLGQVKTDEKSNEITAIPELLNLLDLKGSVVTIDAMGCQKSIAKKIISEDGDYVLTVKDNQKNLKEDVTAFFADKNLDSDIKVDFGHGRI